MTNLRYVKFSELDLNDPFFDSLKSDYIEFGDWFIRKSNSDERAYILREKVLKGFLYLKIENGPINDVVPALTSSKYLKVGTMKIEAHGTKLGERFIKKILDHAVAKDVDAAYVTVFAKHVPLVSLLKRYGFSEYAKKVGANGEELVLLKDLRVSVGDIMLDYPRVSIGQTSQYLLAIYPEYHTKFLPDSKLKNEAFDILEDVSHANSIHKIYISGLSTTSKLKSGDLLLMYRTTDIPGKARFRSVATSVGVVEEVRRIGSFATEQEFLDYVRPYSVFKIGELAAMYAAKKRHNAIRFSYNIALAKRIIRGRLLDEVQLPQHPRRWDFLALTQQQFSHVMHLGEVNEGYFIN